MQHYLDLLYVLRKANMYQQSGVKLVYYYYYVFSWLTIK